MGTENHHFVVVTNGKPVASWGKFDNLAIINLQFFEHTEILPKNIDQTDFALESNQKNISIWMERQSICFFFEFLLGLHGHVEIVPNLDRFIK